MPKLVPQPTVLPRGRTRTFRRSITTRAIAVGLAAVVPAIYAGGTLMASASALHERPAVAVAPGPITSIGRLRDRTGYLGSEVYRAALTPRNAHDLLVLSVISGRSADHVTSVTGGGATSWSAAG